jgi:hypothetical protein
MQDDYSTSDDMSFFSTSIETIVSFEVEEVEIRREITSSTNLLSSTSSSEVSRPVLLDRDDDILELNTKINNYQKELKIYSRLQMWSKNPKEDSSLNSKKSLRPTQHRHRHVENTLTSTVTLTSNTSFIHNSIFTHQAIRHSISTLISTIKTEHLFPYHFPD